MSKTKIYSLLFLVIYSLAPIAQADTQSPVTQTETSSQDKEDRMQPWIKPALIVIPVILGVGAFLLFKESSSFSSKSFSDDISHIDAFQGIKDVTNKAEILSALKHQILRTQGIAEVISQNYGSLFNYGEQVEFYKNFVLKHAQNSKIPAFSNVTILKSLGRENNTKYVEIEGKFYYLRPLEVENSHEFGALEALATYELQEALRKKEPDLYALVPRAFLAKVDGKMVVLQEEIKGREIPEIPLNIRLQYLDKDMASLFAMQMIAAMGFKSNNLKDNSLRDHTIPNVLKYFQGFIDQGGTFKESVLMLWNLHYAIGERDTEARNIILTEKGFQTFDYNVGYDSNPSYGSEWCFAGLETLLEDDEYILRLNPYGRMLPFEYSDIFMRAFQQLSDNEINQLLRPYIDAVRIRGSLVRKHMMEVDYKTRQKHM